MLEYAKSFNQAFIEIPLPNILVYKLLYKALLEIDLAVVKLVDCVVKLVKL